MKFTWSAGAFIALASLVSVVPAADKLKEPTTVIVNSKEENKLTVLFGTVNVSGSKINLRAYGQDAPDKTNPAKTKPLLPGPTFVFHPGDLLRINLHNYLNRSSNPALNTVENNPQEAAPGQADDTLGHVPHEISIPNDSDITNLHVHGLHVDPKQDNVTLLVLPEDSAPSGLVPEMQRLVPTINRWWTRPYKYKIPIDHIPGTYWYHSHKHGSTSTQVENGMAGTLLMLPKNDADSIIPGLWNNDPAKTHDRVLVVQEIANFGIPPAGGPGSGTGLGKGRKKGLGPDLRVGPGIGRLKGLATPTGQGPFSNPNNLNSPVTTINGQYIPTLQIPVGQLERWRFIIAGANHVTSSSIWVGKIVPKTLPPGLQTALTGITDAASAAPYIKGTSTFPNTPLIVSCVKIPGDVKLITVDGIPMWEAVDISPSSPTLGGAGNRSDLLIQPGPGADTSGPYYVYQNYPLLLDDLAKAYPNLFGAPAGAAAAARFSALTKGTMANGSVAYTFVESVTGQADKPVPNAITTDTYALGSNYQGLSVPNWANVDQAGNLSGAPGPQSVTPLIRGVANDTTKGVDVGKLPQNFPNDPGWQPTGAGSGKPAKADILMSLDISGQPTGPKMPTAAALNLRLSQLSPATHQPQNTQLKMLNKHGQLVPGIPSYVAPLPPKVDGRQVVMFDRGQFTFTYLDKTNGNTLDFRQFWLNGRQFNADDFVGNPIANQLIQSPLVNVEPQLGSYSPNAAETLWTHQIGTGVSSKLIITNPAYFLPIKLLKSQDGSMSGYNYDYSKSAAGALPNYTALTGLTESGPPQSTTAEEWLLVNNSDMYHPFHIHISPFFVEEIGQLNYNAGAGAGQQWTLTNLSNSNSPFKWVAGNWWDVIMLPPHGYVKMKTWINVPDQLPINSDDPNSDVEVVENANVYGSWVLHCHILRHEDRGMMTMVNTIPKPTSLSGTWLDSTGAQMDVIDDHGAVTVTGVQGSTISGAFNQGLGNPFKTQPWAGAMVFETAMASTTKTFCVTDDVSQIIFSDGSIWAKAKPTLTPATAPINLTGNWIDADNNTSTITQTTTSTGATLTFTPTSANPVWWGTGTGKWPAGVVPQTPTGIANYFAGTQVLVNNAGKNQQLNFCVSADGNSISFGNGIKWTRSK